jgi:hypothetical protein
VRLAWTDAAGETLAERTAARVLFCVTAPARLQHSQSGHVGTPTLCSPRCESELRQMLPPVSFGPNGDSSG